MQALDYAAEPEPPITLPVESDVRRRLVDREQIAGKLSVKRADVEAHIQRRPPMPRPAGYFRGRVLWDEHEIDAWIDSFDADPGAGR